MDDDDWRQRDDEARQDLENIRLQMDKTTDKSLESTRNMVRLTEASTEAGAGTLVMLNEQGDQLRLTETRLDEAHESLQEAGKNLDQLEKCCGCCILPWKRGGGIKLKSLASTYDRVDEKEVKRREKEAKKKEKEEAKADKEKGLDSSKPAVDAPIPPDEQFIERITNDDREEEMNKNMNDVSHMLHSMKAMGTDMYTEISRQNADIERIKTKADIMDDQTNLANKRAQKIVRDQ